MSGTHIPSVPGQRHLPLRTKVMWGFGGLADNFMFNTMTALGTMVYVNHFKLTPALAGLALGLPRIFDAITDPINPHFPALRSGHRLFQRSSPQKQIPSNIRNLGKAARRATLAANEFPSEISKLGQIPARLGVFSYRNTAHCRTEALLPPPFPPQPPFPRPPVRPPALSTVFTPKANS